MQHLNKILKINDMEHLNIIKLHVLSKFMKKLQKEKNNIIESTNEIVDELDDNYNYDDIETAQFLLAQNLKDMDLVLEYAEKTFEAYDEIRKILSN